MKLHLPPYIQAFVDRHGHARYYFRRPGFKRVALPGIPYSQEFMSALAMATDGQVLVKENVGVNRTIPGTINALAVAFLNSGEFKQLSQSTRATYRGIIDRFRADHGDKRVKMLERHHITRLVGSKADKPAAAHNLLRMLRLLMKFAVTNGWRRDDPTIGIKAPKMRKGGFYTWTEADIHRFEERHPIGSRARLAMALLLYTAQRRSDVVTIGRQHIQRGILSLQQKKTAQKVEIPVHHDLRIVIDATPRENLTLLVTEAGRPFTAAGFGNWFREVCNQAGLPKECAAHGLRKAASRRLAEAGCTAHEIMAITGHRTMREVTRYTEAVDRRRLAASAIAKIKRKTSSVKPGEAV